MTRVLAIATGDPQGIGPAVSIVASRRAEELGARAILVGDVERLRALGAVENDAIAVHHVPCGELSDPPPSAAGGAAAMVALEAACDLVDQGTADALVTAPLSKEAVAHTVSGFVGHTGWLGRRYDSEPIMMLASTGLRVVLATDHLPLTRVAEALDQKTVERAIRAALDAGREIYGVAAPSVAVLGLNPHAGEGGRLGREEIDVIVPAIEACGGARNGVTGPHPADAFFRPGRREPADVVVAMYHDQGLIPLKALSGGEAVNISLGLPILRTSPDHGTAFDLPDDVTPDPTSMIRAVEEALRQTRD